MGLSVFEEVAHLVGEGAAEALREHGLLRQVLSPLPVSPKEAMRYKVIVRASAKADYKHPDRYGLIREFMSVLQVGNPQPQGGYRYYHHPSTATKAEKIWTVRGAAYKQYKLACSVGLLAWFVPIHMVPDHSLTETNA